MSSRPPKDIVIRDKLYRTLAGWRSREGLVLGYTEKRGHSRSGLVLGVIQFERGFPIYRVTGDGWWLRNDLYVGPLLGRARQVFADYDHEAASAEISGQA